MFKRFRLFLKRETVDGINSESVMERKKSTSKEKFLQKFKIETCFYNELYLHFFQ